MSKCRTWPHLVIHIEYNPFAKCWHIELVYLHSRRDIRCMLPESELIPCRVQGDLGMQDMPDDTLPHLFLAHLIIIGLKEVSRHVRPQQEGESLVKDWHCKDLAVAFIAIVHQFHRPLHEWHSEFSACAVATAQKVSHSSM